MLTSPREAFQRRRESAESGEREQEGDDRRGVHVDTPEDSEVDGPKTSERIARSPTAQEAFGGQEEKQEDAVCREAKSTEEPPTGNPRQSSGPGEEDGETPSVPTPRAVAQGKCLYLSSFH